jgi:hypothetical protein
MLDGEQEVAAREMVGRMNSNGSNVGAQRLNDGSVLLVMRTAAEGGWRVAVVTMSVDQWCEMIASVRPVGDTPTDLEAARRFHEAPR